MVCPVPVWDGVALAPVVLEVIPTDRGVTCAIATYVNVVGMV